HPVIFLHAVLRHGVLGHRILGHRVLRHGVLLHAVLGHRVLLHSVVLGHLVLGEGGGREREAERDGSSRDSERKAGANGHDGDPFECWLWKRLMPPQLSTDPGAALLPRRLKFFTLGGFLPPSRVFSSPRATQFRPRRTRYSGGRI